MERGINHNCERCGKSHDLYDLGMYNGKIVCSLCFMDHVMPCSKEEFNDRWDDAQFDLKSEEENEKGEA